MAMSIKDDLITIGAIRIENIDLYSKGTRDNPELEVLFDTESGVIFIPIRISLPQFTRKGV